jgi:hypothetical protein
MAEKSKSLSVEELDLVEFLVAQVASLSSSLTVEMTCEATIAVSPAPPLLACEAMDLQSDPSSRQLPPDPVASEVCLKGAVSMCFRRSA